MSYRTVYTVSGCVAECGRRVLLVGRAGQQSSDRVNLGAQGRDSRLGIK